MTKIDGCRSIADHAALLASTVSFASDDGPFHIRKLSHCGVMDKRYACLLAYLQGEGCRTIVRLHLHQPALHCQVVMQHGRRASAGRTRTLSVIIHMYVAHTLKSLVTMSRTHICSCVNVTTHMRGCRVVAV